MTEYSEYYSNDAILDHLQQSGVLALRDFVQLETITPVVNAIQYHNSFPKKERVKIIKLYVNSNGGDMESARELIAEMRQSEIPVATYVQSCAYSSGLLVSMAGTPGHRYINPDGWVMSHQFSAGSPEVKSHELKAAAMGNKIAQRWMIDHYKQCTGLTEKAIKAKWLGPSDYWATGEEAQKAGFADHLLGTSA